MSVIKCKKKVLINSGVIDENPAKIRVFSKEFLRKTKKQLLFVLN